MQLWRMWEITVECDRGFAIVHLEAANRQIYARTSEWGKSMCSDANELELVKAAVESAGFFAHVRSTEKLGEQLVCASEYSNDVFCGTSCWIIFFDNCWILGSFGYRRWLVQNRDNLVCAVIEWFTADSGPGCPPAEVIEARKLREMSDDEFKRFLASKG